jgi:hypothetical protein
MFRYAVRHIYVTSFSLPLELIYKYFHCASFQILAAMQLTVWCYILLSSALELSHSWDVAFSNHTTQGFRQNSSSFIRKRAKFLLTSLCDDFIGLNNLNWRVWLHIFCSVLIAAWSMLKKSAFYFVLKSLIVVASDWYVGVSLSVEKTPFLPSVLRLIKPGGRYFSQQGFILGT